jgi:putative acetyltransferase
MNAIRTSTDEKGLIDSEDDLWIRPERTEERVVVYRLVKAAFGRDDEAGLIDRLRDTCEFVPDHSLTAVSQGRIIGHVLFTRLFIDGRDSAVRSLALAPIAVLPHWQRKGTGSALVKAGLAECRRLEYECVVVVGDPAFYSRFGFSPARAYGLECPFPVPDEVFMVVEIIHGVLAGKGGTVKYADPFSVSD